MSSKHSFFIAAACALPLSITGCGGSSNGPTTVVGTHHQYVVSNAFVPTMSTQAGQFGLDLGSRTSSKPDGTVDNAIGAVLGSLAMLKFDIQGTITTAVNQGSILLLLDVQSTDFANASASGLTVKLGSTPNPPACSGPTDMTCRHHLAGTGAFQVAADSPAESTVAGNIVNGAFAGGPGDLTLQIAIGSTTAINLDLVHARATATGISDTGIMSGIIGGVVTQAELTTQVGPPLLASVQAIFDRDCPTPRSPPDCNCGAGTTGALVAGVVDFSPKDCNLTIDELFGNPIVAPMLKPESCSMDSCTTADALSIGIKFEAVKATFPM